MGPDAPLHDGGLMIGWLYLPVAFALGALHALEPGHGKTLGSVYLIGGKHNWRDAVVMGIATTLAHTFVILLLAGVSLWLERSVSSAQTTRMIGLVGAVLLIAVGLWMGWRAARALVHGHSHDHDHHSHATTQSGSGFWALVAVGASNGLLPCPGALAALLFAISTGRMGLGLVTVLAYSAGLAVALSVIGMVAIGAGQALARRLPNEKALLWLPVASAVLIIGTGVWMLGRIPR